MASRICRVRVVATCGWLSAAGLACLLAGCGAVVSQPVGTGHPTIAAATARIEGSAPACLVLSGVREILPTDKSTKVDLSVFRNKTLLLIYSQRKAITVASLVDVALSAPGGNPIPVNLAPEDYQLVEVSADGALSQLPAAAIDTMRIEPAGN